MRIIAASAPLRRSPQADAPLETEALLGESVTVYDEQRGLGLGAARARPVCRLSARRGARSAVRADPSGRGAAHACLSGAGHQAAAAHGALARRAADDRAARRAISRSRTMGFISGRAASLSSARTNRTGSRSRSALSRRLISGAAGRQKASTARAWSRRRSRPAASRRRATATCRRRCLGEPIAIDDPAAPLARGDLVFWKGHVGIMRDPVTLLHANGWHMKTVSEPLAQARERIAANGGGKVTSVRRLSALASAPSS